MEPPRRFLGTSEQGVSSSFPPPRLPQTLTTHSFIHPLPQLSASIDKTARLWHVTRSECLHTFPHSDYVTGVDFHPTNDLLFISGCFDQKVVLGGG